MRLVRLIKRAQSHFFSAQIIFQLLNMGEQMNASSVFKTSVAMLMAFALKPSASMALNDPRVVPGAEILLDVTKVAGPEAIGQIVNQCMYEQTMKSLLPKAWAAHSSSDTVVTITGSAEIEAASSKTQFLMVLPRFDSKTTYVEWSDPTTSAKHFVNFEMTSSGYYSVSEAELKVLLHTDAEGPMMEFALGMYSYLPRIEFLGVSTENCTSNNWGRSICTSSGSVTDAKLVVPQDFVATDVWQNYESGAATKKQFDFADYADCLLYKWENP